MKPKKSNSAPELSRPLAVDKISAGGVEESLSPMTRNARRLAKRFGLLELPKLEAQLTVKPARGGSMFEVKGRMEADVVQQCVVTLEPLPAHIEQAISVLYAAPEWLEPGAGSPHVDPGGGGNRSHRRWRHRSRRIGRAESRHRPRSLSAQTGACLMSKRNMVKPRSKVNPFAKLAELTKTGKDKRVDIKHRFLFVGTIMLALMII